MCGAYALADEQCEEVQVIISALDARYPRSAWHFGEVRPSETAPVLVSDAGKIHARLFQWGFEGHSSLVINARAETAAEKPLFADSLAKRRCVIPAAGFYEWDTKKGKHLFAQPGSSLVYMAGIYDLFGGRPHYCILTTEANGSVRGVHPRMPLVLLREQVRSWLEQPGQTAELLGIVPPELESKAEG